MFQRRNAFHDGRAQSAMLGEQLGVLRATLLKFHVQVGAEICYDTLYATTVWDTTTKDRISEQNY